MVPYLNCTSRLQRKRKALWLRLKIPCCCVTYWCDLCMQHDTIAHNFPQMAHWVNCHSWLLFIWHGISHSSYSNNVNAIQDTRPSSQNIVGTQDLMVSPKADDNNLLRYDLGENILKLYILTWRVKWGLITWNIPLDLSIGFSTSYWNHLTPLNIFF